MCKVIKVLNGITCGNSKLLAINANISDLTLSPKLMPHVFWENWTSANQGSM